MRPFTGSSAEWGTLEVTGRGALVAADVGTVSVPLSDSSATTASGDGWMLRLAPGWRLLPGTRSGDLTASH